MSSIDLAGRLLNLETAVFGGPNPSGAPAPSKGQLNSTTLSGSADVLAFNSNNYVATAGVDAMTLAAPISGPLAKGGQDGVTCTVTDIGGHAHTITLGSNNLVPSHHLLTFNGTKGSFVTLEANGGLWYVKSSVGVTAS
jgi:hypothetical protein